MSNAATDLIGYRVLSADEHIVGEVEHVLDAVGTHLVVKRGWWIFAAEVLVPASAVVKVFHRDRAVLVDRTKKHLRDAPVDVEGQATRALRLP